MIRLFVVLLLLLFSCKVDTPTATTVCYKIGGMHCDSCVESITADVLRVDGVVSCIVSLENEKAVVTITDPVIATTILENIRKLKFTVELVEQE